MLLDAMAAAKPPKSRTPSTRTRKAPAPAPARADGRVKSRLTLAREAGAIEAGRALLLETLTAQGWNLSATAEALGVGTAGAVIRAIREHGLEPEYEAARRRGDIKPGPRRED